MNPGEFMVSIHPVLIFINPAGELLDTSVAGEDKLLAGLFQMFKIVMNSDETSPDSEESE